MDANCGEFRPPRTGPFAGGRSAIFQRQRHDVPLPFGRKQLDVDVDDLMHLGPRIVTPLRRQCRACLAPRDLLALPVVQETTVDAHPCNVGTNHPGLETELSARPAFSLEIGAPETGGGWPPPVARTEHAGPSDSPERVATHEPIGFPANQASGRDGGVEIPASRKWRLSDIDRRSKPTDVASVISDKKTATPKGREMTASAATVEGLSRLGLPEREPDQVDQTRPAGKAEEQARNQAQVGAPRRLTRDRVHHVTILSVIAAVQLGWIVALIYGLQFLLG